MSYSIILTTYLSWRSNDSIFVSCPAEGSLFVHVSFMILEQRPSYGLVTWKSLVVMADQFFGDIQPSRPVVSQQRVTVWGFFQTPLIPVLVIVCTGGLDIFYGTKIYDKPCGSPFKKEQLKELLKTPNCLYMPPFTSVCKLLTVNLSDRKQHPESLQVQGTLSHTSFWLHALGLPLSS